MNWILENAGQLFQIVIAAHALALLIVNLTPTPKDNEILAKLYKGIEWVAGVFPMAKK